MSFNLRNVGAGHHFWATRMINEILVTPRPADARRAEDFPLA